jgi:uncharacterized phage protein (TIGR01671 family)
MREIKFRCWNGITNQMVCEPMIRADYEFSLSEYMNTDRGWQWMQFTGLHDKNGKEIYEGDIVSLTLIEDAGLGHKTDALASVCWDTDDTGFYYDTDCGTFPHAKPWFADNVIIIGNIHESPDLLK